MGSGVDLINLGRGFTVHSVMMALLLERSILMFLVQIYWLPVYTSELSVN